MQWLFFTVGITLAPLIFNYFIILLTKSSLTNNPLISFSPKGEVLIVSAAIVGEATSDLFSRAIAKNYKLILGGFCIVTLIVACLLFAFISTVQPDRINNPILMTELSLFFFIVALSLGFLCKVAGRS